MWTCLFYLVEVVTSVDTAVIVRRHVCGFYTVPKLMIDCLRVRQVFTHQLEPFTRRL